MNFASLSLLAFTLALAITSGAAAEMTNHYVFRFPQRQEFQIAPTTETLRPGQKIAWLKAWSVEPTPRRGLPKPKPESVEFGSKLVLQLAPGTDLRQVLGGSLAVSRVISSNLFLLQAPDAPTAAREAHRLARLKSVWACYPVIRQETDLHGPYAPLPKEFWWVEQWPLENRSTNGTRLGVDLNARAAWPASMGQGITIAVADTGVEFDHLELNARVTGAPHYNFAGQNTNAAPYSRFSNGAHGTEVAGLAAASLNNGRMAGVAPLASVASWLIFHTNSTLASDDELMQMYQYASNVVSVQNHSWGHVGLRLRPTTLLEEVGISNAIAYGRSGRGSIFVRSSGNDRQQGANACDDAYPNDPRVIAVGAVRRDGRVATYSEPGACVLVAAPSGDATAGFLGLLTTDLLGTDGVNQLMFFPPNEDLPGYVFFSFGFSGTSAAAPQVAGVVALMLAKNPYLTYRDVQHILALASRHFDFADPGLQTNGAGYQVSHSVGFGVPDAAQAVALARTWSGRPAQQEYTFTATNLAAIPDDGLRVLVSGQGVPPELASVPTLPGTGPHADTPTPALPLVDFGYGTNLAGFNLTNRGALIQRGADTFATAITRAAQAGAAFAIVYNYPGDPPGGDQLVPMGATDFVPIPAVFIGNTAGEKLKQLFLTNQTALAQIHLQSTNYTFTITNNILCEHVGLRVMSDHPLRGDLRITLVSPSGTRSVLQQYNADTTPGPVDWTYYSSQHFFENSAGTWTAWVSDEGEGNTGSVQSVSLVLQGVPIQDRDRDALDDAWEVAWFGCLPGQSASGDPDQDGYSNSREQLMGTDPTRPNHIPFPLDLSRWNPQWGRLSWASSPGATYEILAGASPNALTTLTNIPGTFPETEWFTPISSGPQFFRVRELQPVGSPQP